MPIPVAAVLEAEPAPFVIAALPACAARDLTLSFDGENGAFDGMSHGGTLMVVRNVGSAACRLAALPQVAFAGPNGHVLPIRFAPPAGFHPGPVVLPVGVAPGAEVTAALTWVAGPVFPGGYCYTATAVRVSFDGATVEAPFRGQFCGPAAGATFNQGWLRTDPRLQP